MPAEDSKVDAMQWYAAVQRWIAISKTLLLRKKLHPLVYRIFRNPGMRVQAVTFAPQVPGRRPEAPWRGQWPVPGPARRLYRAQGVCRGQPGGLQCRVGAGQGS